MSWKIKDFDVPDCAGENGKKSYILGPEFNKTKHMHTPKIVV